MDIEISEQDKLTSNLLTNVGIAVGNEPGGTALPTALAMMRRAYKLNPFDIGRMMNLASTLARIGEDEEAEKLLTACLKRDPNMWLPWQIMGFIRTHSGDLDEATQCFKRAYDIDPENGQRAFDLASAYMRAGDFARGLPLYERRHEILPRTSPPPPAPTWLGDKTGHLAVWADQGHGDRIMFARFLVWAKERADKITLITDPASVPLLAGYSVIADIACGWNAEDRFDHQVSLGSLPLVYGMTADNIPPDPGLLSVADTRGSLGAPGLKIGIVWFGNPNFPGNDMRTVPFEELLPLAADPRNTVFSLQVGPRSADIAKARAQRIIHDMSGQIEGDWSHTAAVIKQLDLVVSSCTAVAHLAGALNVPSFIMLPRFADWRWLHGRDDTPWYPRTRLFRQTRGGQWKDVVDRILKAINQMHGRRDLVTLLNRTYAGESADAVAAGCEVDGVYEPDVVNVLKRVLRPGDCFIDVGASEGKHVKLAADLVGTDGRVLAFEPGPNVLPKLKQMIRERAIADIVEVVGQPVSNVAEEVTFHLCADGPDGNALWEPKLHPFNSKTRLDPRSVQMQATTLDKEIAARRLRPRLIKIDTEGAEQKVLEGTMETLFEQHVPFIVAELHEFGLDRLGHSQRSLREMMERAGYATFLLSADGSRPRLIAPGQTIKGRWIVNILFATQADVDALWPAEAQAA